MRHIQLDIIATAFQQEELIALFDDYNPTGFEQTDEMLKAYFEEKYFSHDEILKILEGYDYGIAIVEEQNWNMVWEQNFQPVVVEDFCAVRAHFHEPIKNIEHEIIITPKMSFGTGHHATTYMMMQQMREINFHEKEVFDFGTGTGILAILAEKLGAAGVSAIDVDEWSIENASENFEQNGCTKTGVTLSSDLPNKQIDVILANINRNVILAYIESLVKILKNGSLVLFSGLLVADEEAIKDAAAQHGLQFEKRAERQGWISLLFVNQR